MTITVILCCFTSPALAFSVDTPLADVAQESRAQALFQQVKCVVCAGQSLATSNVEVAQAMRDAIRSRVATGEEDSVVLYYLTARYGEGVLLSPPVHAATFPLWAAPFMLLLAGGVLIMLRARKR